MPKNYYIALGVSKGADLNQIKRAYRKIIKNLHPDLSHTQTTQERFIEIQEAYETLADPEKRRIHDAFLEEKKPHPKRSGAPIHTPPVFETNPFPATSLADEFFEGFLPGFFSSPERGSVDKDIYLEVILTPEEAQNGGVFPVTVPVVEPCFRCRGEAYLVHFPCPVCRGQGAVRQTRSFSLGIPPRTRDGEHLRLSLKDIGLPGVTLHIDVRMEPETPFF
ncbi:MAG: DnaJ domain-containing protein [Deltaproteobacteria bacterium]|nr:DnaJ domain-containing protein [Deltaproteobacteria bacterium]MBW1954473.1 DnaJ domain-containing protein [Deltaproteobacteria bacterium]MBW2042132.1 DnaJ domain-containing protein [Deltaproteobacteria bacterium]MBW2132310.1 DnaJ domain-containing protein [Deltaproteobacteria bacterium]